MRLLDVVLEFIMYVNDVKGGFDFWFMVINVIVLGNLLLIIKLI